MINDFKIRLTNEFHNLFRKRNVVLNHEGNTMYVPGSRREYDD